MEDYAQQAQRTGTLGALNPAAGQILTGRLAPNETQSEFAAIIARLQELNGRAVQVASAANAVADRILGAVPEKDGGPRNAEVPPEGIVAHLRLLLSSVESSVDRASYHIERIGSATS